MPFLLKIYEVKLNQQQQCDTMFIRSEASNGGKAKCKQNSSFKHNASKDRVCSSERYCNRT